MEELVGYANEDLRPGATHNMDVLLNIMREAYSTMNDTTL